MPRFISLKDETGCMPKLKDTIKQKISWNNKNLF